MKIEKIHFYKTLSIHKKSIAETLNLKKVPVSIQDFKELSQKELREVNKGLVHYTTAYLSGSKTSYDLFEKSFLELPDEIKFGYYSLFGETFPKENYIVLFENLDSFISAAKKKYEKSNKVDRFYNQKGIRAAYLIKVFSGYIEFGQKNYEKSLAIFQDIEDTQEQHEIKTMGMIALNYFLLEKYDEFEKCVLNDKHNDSLLKYLKIIYYYYVKEDITAAMNAVFPAMINNPFVLDIDQVLFPDFDDLSDLGLSSMLEAQLVFDYIVPVLGIEAFDIFYKKAREVRKVIRIHPELSNTLNAYYKHNQKNIMPSIELNFN
jgi:hypothetical protein